MVAVGVEIKATKGNKVIKVIKEIKVIKVQVSKVIRDIKGKYPNVIYVQLIVDHQPVPAQAMAMRLLFLLMTPQLNLAQQEN